MFVSPWLHSCVCVSVIAPLCLCLHGYTRVCVSPHSYVLDQILSGVALDEVIGQVQTFLQMLAEEVRGDAISLQQYVITKVGVAM